MTWLAGIKFITLRNVGRQPAPDRGSVLDYRQQVHQDIPSRDRADRLGVGTRDNLSPCWAAVAVWLILFDFVNTATIILI